jgi:uroporphyrinogen-III synthase
VRGWFLITRPADEVTALAAHASRHGLELLPFPALLEEAYEDEAGWEALAALAPSPRWLAVTSARAPRHLVRAARSRGLWNVISSSPVAAVGGATAAACREQGLTVELEGNAGAAALGRTIAARVQRGEVVVHAAGREHRSELLEAVAASGAVVLALAVYAMREAESRELPELPSNAPVAVVLTSPRAAGVYGRACGRRFAASPHYVLGPTSAAEVERLGYAPVLRQGSLESIVEELCLI